MCGLFRRNCAGVELDRFERYGYLQNRPCEKTKNRCTGSIRSSKCTMLLFSLLCILGKCCSALGITVGTMRLRSDAISILACPHRTGHQCGIAKDTFSSRCHIQTPPSFGSKERIIKTILLGSNNDDLDENEEKKKIGSVYDRVSRLGSKVFKLTSSSKSEQDGEDEKDEKDETDDKKKRKWFRRLLSTSSEKETNSEDVDRTDEKPEPRAKNPFGQQQIFSEVSLATELGKQKALDQYISGEFSQTPEEFLPAESSKGGSLGVDVALDVIDDSLSYIRGKLGEIRMNSNDENNSIFLTPEQEEKKLNQLRRDLEQRRKALLLKEVERKKIAAAEKAKEEKEKRADEKLKSEERVELKKIIAKAAKGEKVDIQINSDPVMESKPEEKGRLANALSSASEGAMVGIQSAVSSAWQSVVSKGKTKDEEEWIVVCPKTRVSPGEVYPVVAGGLDLLIIGSKDGTKIHCITNSCSHLGTPLETGIIERRPCPKRTGPKRPSNSLSTDDITRESINDGCQDCIVCPLHRTAFALDTGEVVGEWCPYPPFLGNMMGTVKKRNDLTTFQMRTRGKNIEIKISSSID